MAEDQGPGIELANQLLKQLNAAKEAQAKDLRNQHRPPQFAKRCHQWGLRDHWTLEEAANLLSHCDPERPLGLEGHGALDAYVREMRAVIERSRLKPEGKKGNLYVARDLYAWAQTQGLAVPAELTEAMEARTKSAAGPSEKVIDRHCCEAIARTLWGLNPDRTIADLIKDPAIQRFGNGAHYTENTLRGWIKDHNPRPAGKRRGRPRKTIKK